MGFDTDTSYLSIHAYIQNTQIQMLTDDDNVMSVVLFATMEQQADHA